jgi:NAD(P) transhydrogenase subunit alpha
VITTALIFGKKAPTLITEGMVKRMKHGSIIVDLAAEQGGNCELTEPGKNINKNGVIICGILNLPSTLPIDASQMYSKNITNFFKHIYNAKDGAYDFDDEITASTCITHKGKIVNKLVERVFQKGEQSHD